MRVTFPTARRRRNAAASKNARKGLASLLAMLYLVLFATLAVGFVETTSLSSQVARNDAYLASSRVAADAGIEFMRYQLGSVNLSIGTNSANLLNNVATQLSNSLNGTTNMGGNTVAITGGTTIYLPSPTGFIPVDPVNNDKFQVAITQVPNTTKLVVTVHGYDGSSSVTCGIQLQFQAQRGFSVVGLSSLTTGSQNNGRPLPKIDSWNSVNGPYGTFPMDSNGDVSSNGNITLVSGTQIEGDAEPGIGKTISKTGSTVTGSTAQLSTKLTYPTPTPGSAATTNDNASLPSKYFNSATRDLVIPTGAPALTLPGGTYYVNNIDWEAATIKFTGPVVFYVTGTGTKTHPGYGLWTFNNLVTTYQNRPANLVFEVTTNASVQYDFDQPINASVYAPLSTVKTWGAASDYGSIVGNNLDLYTGWHVDESLSADGGGPYVPVQGSYIEGR